MDNNNHRHAGHEPEERLLRLLVKSQEYPGFLEYLSSLPNRAEAPLIRAILYDWYTGHREAGTLTSTTDSFLRNLNLGGRQHLGKASEASGSTKAATTFGTRPSIGAAIVSAEGTDVNVSPLAKAGLTTAGSENDRASSDEAAWTSSKSEDVRPVATSDLTEQEEELGWELLKLD